MPDGEISGSASYRVRVATCTIAAGDGIDVETRRNGGRSGIPPTMATSRATLVGGGLVGRGVLPLSRPSRRESFSGCPRAHGSCQCGLILAAGMPAAPLPQSLPKAAARLQAVYFS